MVFRSSIIVSFASLLLPGTPAAESWPLFRGDARQTGVAASKLPDKLDIRWKFKSKDAIEGAVAIAHGMVYVGSMDEHLYALDLASGREKWRYKGGPFKAAASVHKGAVYIGDADGLYHCVDAASGKRRWTFETGGEIGSGANFHGESLLFGSGDETLYCLGLDGRKRWEFKVPGGPVMGSPAVIENRTFAAGCDSALHVLDVVSGKEVSAAVDLGGQVGASAAVVGDLLFIGTMSSEVLGVNWKKGEIEWRFEATTRRQPFYASAAATETLVITGSRDKHVYALDRKTGREIWKYATRNRVDSSPVVVDKRVFIGSHDGHLYMLDLAKGTELAKWDLGSPIAASPAVAGDYLVIGSTDGTVYCFGAKPRGND